MDTSTLHSIDDKKWFVYIIDHHEGPYSVAEVKDKVAKGQISADVYIWAEGMADWQPMSAVAAFGPPPGPPVTAPPAAAHPREQQDGPTLTTTRLEMPKKSSEPKMEVRETRTNISSAAPPVTLVAASRVSAAPTDGNETVALERPLGNHGNQQRASTSKTTSTSASTLQKKSGSGMKIFLLLLVLIGALVAASTQGYLDPVLQSPAMQAATRAMSDSLRPLVAKVPALAQFISPIPSLDDVSPEDYEELKTAASASPVRLAVAVSKADLMAPSFYVASALPDGAQVDVWIEGVSDTLLNQTSYSGHATAKINQKLAKTETVRMPDGKPIPRGQYLLYVTEGDSQPDPVKPVISELPNSTVPVPASLQPQLKEKKLLIKKSYFLGGPRDQTYVARLQEFHDRIKAKASNELIEVKQLSALLESQMDGSIATFDKLRKGPAKPSKVQLAVRTKAWDDFNTKWNQVQEQVNQSLGKITPEALTQEYFYGPLYQMTQQTAQETNKLHELHHAFFKSAPDMSAFDIQLGQVTAQTRTAMTSLKAKLEEIEKLPASASGLPQKMPATEKQP